MAIQFNGQITPIKTTPTKEVVKGQDTGPLAPQMPTTPIVSIPSDGTVDTPIPPPPQTNCRLSTHGLALGETPISLSGTIVEHFNDTYTPFLNISQTDGLHRTEAARRLSESDPNNDWIFVNTGEILQDKCFAVNNTQRSRLVIPNTNKIAFINFYFPQFQEFLYIGTDMSLYRLERKGIPPDPAPGTNLGSGKIYTKIDQLDILKNQQHCITYGMWSGNVGNLLTFFTSSNQNTGSRLYNLEVRNKVYTDCTSEVQFSIAYGHADGSGSYDLGGYDYLTPSKAVYGQYKLLCLEQSESFFNINNENAKSIYVVNVRRARMGDRMDEGNWELNLHHLSGSQFLAGGGNRNAYTGSNIKLGHPGRVLRLIDDSKINSGSVTSAGNVYRIVSGSIEDGVHTPTTPVVYGLSYPALGILVLNGNRLDANASFCTVTGSQVSGSNPHQLLTAMSGAALYTDVSGDYKGFQSRKVKKQHITHYFVRVKNDAYNHTNNYTWMTGSEGEVHPNFRYSDGTPITYITQVGLYNERKELLAVAKPSKAILKTCTDEALFKVQLKWE